MKPVALIAIALIAAFTGCRTTPQTIAPIRPQIAIEIEHHPEDNSPAIRARFVLQ